MSAIPEGAAGAAERGCALDQGHLMPLRGQHLRCNTPGEAAADDQDCSHVESSPCSRISGEKPIRIKSSVRACETDILLAAAEESAEFLRFGDRLGIGLVAGEKL